MLRLAPPPPAAAAAAAARAHPRARTPQTQRRETSARFELWVGNKSKTVSDEIGNAADKVLKQEIGPSACPPFKYTRMYKNEEEKE